PSPPACGGRGQGEGGARVGIRCRKTLTRPPLSWRPPSPAMRERGLEVSELDTLIQLLARLPGLGPRSARRAALYLIKRREQVMQPLAAALGAAAAAIRPCTNCGNLDTADPCAICRDPERDRATICVVEDLADLWALERTGAFRGRYHVLGGTLSALDGIGPDELNIAR